MPIPTTCPSCQTVYSLADHLRGKKVRCKNCDEVIVVGASAKARSAEERDEGAGRQERIQSGARRPKLAPARDEDERPRRREREDSSRPGRKSNRGLIIGLIAGGVGLLLLVAGGILVAVLLLGKTPNSVSDLLVDGGGPWPEPRGGFMAPDSTITVHVAGAADEPTRDAIRDKLGALADAGRGSGVSSASQGDRMTVRITPVRDPKAFADKIDFGTVRSVDGRIITMIARKVEGAPAANADVVTKALFDLKSPSVHRRMEAVRRLKETLPDERRGEVTKALEPLVTDSDHFTREWAIEALGVWGTKETVPVLLKAMNQKETRGAAIKALGRLKDERAIEPIAERLEDFFDRGPASDALKKMGPVAENAVIKRLNHSDRHVRTTACDILKVIGTKESLPALQKVIAENDFFLTPKAKETVQVITARQ
jgi:predicted Zn finger-like uncharacterized protein